MLVESQSKFSRLKWCIIKNLVSYCICSWWNWFAKFRVLLTAWLPRGCGQFSIGFESCLATCREFKRLKDISGILVTLVAFLGLHHLVSSGKRFDSNRIKSWLATFQISYMYLRNKLIEGYFVHFHYIYLDFLLKYLVIFLRDFLLIFCSNFFFTIPPEGSSDIAPDVLSSFSHRISSGMYHADPSAVTFSGFSSGIPPDISSSRYSFWCITIFSLFFLYSSWSSFWYFFHCIIGIIPGMFLELLLGIPGGFPQGIYLGWFIYIWRSV